MSNESILRLLSRGATAIFYFMVLITAYWTVISLIGIFSDGSYYLFGWRPEYDVPQFKLSVKGSQIASSPVFSTDSLVRFTEIKGNYRVNVEPRSAVGYYMFIASLISMVLTLLILKTFMNIFKQVKVEYPFNSKVVTWLRHLALLFILADVCNLANNFIFSALLSQSFTTLSLRFDLSSIIGSNFIIGIFIWVIAVIFQRGIELQEENALTV